VYDLAVKGCDSLLDPDPLKNNPAAHAGCKIAAVQARNFSFAAAKAPLDASLALAEKTAEATLLVATGAILVKFKVWTDKALDDYKKCEAAN